MNKKKYIITITNYNNAKINKGKTMVIKFSNNIQSGKQEKQETL